MKAHNSTRISFKGENYSKRDELLFETHWVSKGCNLAKFWAIEDEL